MQLGVEASRLGTALHAYCEFDCNDQEYPYNPEITREIEQYESFKRSSFVTERKLIPYRTELNVSYGFRDSINVCAGQIDCLYVDCNQKYYIVDFKRVASKHALDPKEMGFRGECGVPPVAGHIPKTHYQSYSLQTSIYNVMLCHSHGIDVEDRMYLLRMHDDRDTYELVKCSDLREEARQALSHEHRRLVNTKGK